MCGVKNTIVLGDIHGRTVWKDIIEKERPDLTIFLGDYVSTHDGIPDTDQIDNLLQILDFKEANPDKVILLRGNHDIQHLGYDWATCSGLCGNVREAMSSPPMRSRFLADSQWIHKMDDIIFSHAGISRVWLDLNGVTLEGLNDIEPCEIFGFTPDSRNDHNGESETQPPTWIRPYTLRGCSVAGYHQVIGHTPLMFKDTPISVRIPSTDHLLYRCDTLPTGYLRISHENGHREITPVTWRSMDLSL